MAVEDKKVYESTTRKPASEESGAIKKTIQQLVSVAAADSDGSIYRIAKLPASAVILDVRYMNSAITAGTDYDLGLYGVDGGAVVDKDILDDGLSFTVAATAAALKQGLTNVAIADRLDQLYELAGDSTGSYPGQYDIALTANTVGSADGTVYVEIDYIIGA
ncbi:MAG: hypothetical protein EOL91_04180 [Actinobacteria bacterium]|nr:hypothetical protein [Actinomycetota bacterium]